MEAWSEARKTFQNSLGRVVSGVDDVVSSKFGRLTMPNGRG
jgi:hypothetical protein